MEVRIRRHEDADSTHFCDCKFNEINKVLAMIKDSGGVFCNKAMTNLTNLDSQIVLEEDGRSSYFEIIASEDDS